MTLSMLQASVVVTAESHNPTILHPHFLKTQGIVPPDFEPAESPVCTPPLAIVKYRNGLNYTASVSSPNPDREIFDRFLKPDPWSRSQDAPISVGIRIVYPCGELAKSLQLSLDPGTIKRERPWNRF